MFGAVMDRYQLRTLLDSLPGLVLSKQQRTLFREMRLFDKTLLRKMDQPLPMAMVDLTPSVVASTPEEGEQLLICRLGDVAILANGASGLGPCLRHSLLRYHFLRRSGLRVIINFGANMVGGKTDRRVTGHAWLTLDQAPYHEAGENWRGFSVMYSFPEQQS
jgi:hypothetical protein